jgi:amidase
MRRKAIYSILISVVSIVLLSSCGSTSMKNLADIPFNFEEATIDRIQSGYASGTLTSVTLVQHYLERITTYDSSGPKINSMITLNPDVLKQAAALDLEREKMGVRGPLHGIPVVLKDNIDTYDMPTTNGSAILKNAVPLKDATLTRQLREAGAIILGKASMGEFAAGSYNTVSGQTINPYNFKRDTGGSSSGSGAAIAADFAVLAVGTDTSTSVRGPAAFTGIVGLRPTTGLISRSGIAPKNLDFDTAGPMARMVTDVAYMLEILAVEDPEDPISDAVWSEVERHYDITDGRIRYSDYLNADSLRGKRIGVMLDLFGGDPEIHAMAEEALDQLKVLGATLIDIKLDQVFMTRYTGAGSSEIRRIADYRFRADWEKYVDTLPGAPKTVAEFIELYQTVVNKSPLPVRANTLNLLQTSLTTSGDDPLYQQLINEFLPRATADKLAIFDDYQVDALVFPYETRFADVISNPVYQLDDPTYVSSSVPVPATLAGYDAVGFPCIVVPMGFGTQGLPMNLAFMGKPFSEGPLLGYAYAYEQVSNKRRPAPLLPPLK